MASESITVFIDSDQLKAQKANKYSLFLAKKVNGAFTVIWQSMGPLATVKQPASYEYKNNFQIAVPSFGVNYGTVSSQQGSVTFDAAGKAVSIDLGQAVALDEQGLFAPPTNTGTAGEITITSKLAGNPHAILLDDSGNPIFVNAESGMDIGTTTLTPIDTYQLWFDNYQDTGTIIAHQVSNPGIVTFSGGTSNKVISYSADGVWLDGPLPAKADFSAALGGAVPPPVLVAVLATFRYALTVGAVTWLTSNLINKFSGGLKPSKITIDGDKKSLRVEFQNKDAQEVLAAFGLDKFEGAVNDALTSAKAVTDSGLSGETWTLTEPSVTLSF